MPKMPNTPIPYWQSHCGNATVYLGDCRHIIPLLSDAVSAVVTDPPYGINFAYSSHDDNESDWYVLMDDVVPKMRAIAPFVVMPNCRIKAMKWWLNNHEPDWIIAWYKGSPGHRSAIGFNDWEPHLVWGRPPVQMHDYFQTNLVIDDNGHPCAKPLAYSEWLVTRAALAPDIILDPFMGSGTTGVACAKNGRRFIGIEIDKKYCDISCERIQRQLIDSGAKPPVKGVIVGAPPIRLMRNGS